MGYTNIKKALERFVALSGREAKVAEVIANYTDKKVETVLDPVLAVDESFWNEKAKKRLIKEPYILCYILSNPEYHAISIDMIKKKHGIQRLVYINTDCIDRQMVYSDYRGCDYKGIVGPKEFYSLFKYATVICTDSFHGTCFSIIFRKNFYVLARTDLWELNSDNRICHVFKQLNMQNRSIYKNIDISKIDDIDYTDVEKHLFERRAHSVSYLEDALNKSI